ncbi:MAG: hypothetical protein ABW194_04075 [Novosphingobium sp.]
MTGRIPLLAVAALAASPAAAQLKPEQQTGSHIRAQPTLVPKAEAGAVRKAFARCMYRSNPAGADALLRNSDPVTINFEGAGIPPKRLQAALGMSDCLGKQAGVNQLALGMKFEDGLLRAMLQEEAYLSVQKAGVALAPRIPGQRQFVAAPEKLGVARALAEFADCLAEKNPSAADRLLRTTPGTDEERAAAGTLAPTLGACLDQGQTLEFTPILIRAFAADGLWNRYVAGSPPTQTAR